MTDPAPTLISNAKNMLLSIPQPVLLVLIEWLTLEMLVVLHHNLNLTKGPLILWLMA